MNRILSYVAMSLFNWIMVSAYGHEALYPMMDIGFQKAVSAYYFGLVDDKKNVHESWFPGRGQRTGQRLFKLYLSQKYS